ncbi:MAG TPA: hypothetical protein VIW24_15940, partial [Aldersonia sp.]
ELDPERHRETPRARPGTPDLDIDHPRLSIPRASLHTMCLSPILAKWVFLLRGCELPCEVT